MNTLATRAPLALLLTLGLAGTCAAQVLPVTPSTGFDFFDTNRDGVVNQWEYDSDRAFAVMDSNHNNGISAAELEAVLGPPQPGWPSAADRIRRADRNEDGELSDEELRHLAEMRFQWLDANADGVLDLDEMTSRFGLPTPPKPWH